MSGPEATPIFVDTGAFYARVDEDDTHHETATQLFENIRSGDVSYRPIFTSHSVLAELATQALYKLGHGDATRILNTVRDSESINILPILIQRGNPALPVSDECSDRSEPRSEQGGRESRTLRTTIPGYSTNDFPTVCNYLSNIYTASNTYGNCGASPDCRRET